MSEEEKKVNVPEKFKDIVEKIEKMSMLEMSELVKVLEEKFGVSAQAMFAAAPAQAGSAEGGGEAGGETLKKVELKVAGDQKVQVIKAIREILNLGLKEAKDLVDAAPKLVKEGLKQAEAEELKQKLEAVGATVEIK